MRFRARSSVLTWAIFAGGIPPIHGQHNYSLAMNSVFPLQEDEASPDLFPMPPCGTFVLEEATIDSMQQAMSNGSLTSVQLTLCYISRIYQTQSYTK